MCQKDVSKVMRFYKVFQDVGARTLYEPDKYGLRSTSFV
jgi:hypothetical protein